MPGIERLEEEKKASADDIREVCAEAKKAGYDPQALRAIIRRRKAPQKAAALDAMVESDTVVKLNTPIGTVFRVM